MNEKSSSHRGRIVDIQNTPVLDIQGMQLLTNNSFIRLTMTTAKVEISIALDILLWINRKEADSSFNLFGRRF